MYDHLYRGDKVYRNKKIERKLFMQKTITAQPKWKSKIFWAGILSLLIALAGQFGLWDVIGMTNETAQNIADTVLTLIGMFGVWNDSGNATEY